MEDISHYIAYINNISDSDIASVISVKHTAKKNAINKIQSFLAIDIGGTKVEIMRGIIDENDTIEMIPVIQIHHRQDGIDTLDGHALYALVKETIDVEKWNNYIDNILISFAGPIKDNVILSYSNLQKLEQSKFFETFFFDYGNYSIHIFNDSEMLLLGNMYYKKGYETYVTIINGTGYNVSFAVARSDVFDFINTEISHIRFPDGTKLKDVTSGMFIEKYQHSMYINEVYNLSCHGIAVSLKKAIKHYDIPMNNAHIMLQGGIIEHTTLYKTQLAKTYSNVSMATELSMYNIVCVGLIYATRFDIY